MTIQTGASLAAKNISPHRDWTLAFGQIRHTRLAPVRHAFSYRGFFVRGNGESLNGNASGNWLFGINRAALLSFHEADHGDGQPGLTWLYSMLANASITGVNHIQYEGFVRVMGYAFKPVSFWHCLREDGATLAIVAEVNNTFGESHCYLLSDPRRKTIAAGQLLTADKHFHVSPFLPVSGAYQFRFHSRANRSVCRIDLCNEQGQVLTTSLSGLHEPVSARAVMRAILGYPLFSLGVVVRIHWQAMRLLAKRIPFLSKPVPPRSRVTSGQPVSSDFS